jgi:2-haloacid dehalogenase
MPPIRFAEFDALTFDCYGTLVDWETGIVTGIRAAVGARLDAADEEILEAYARHEAVLEAGSYLRYREVVADALRSIGVEHGIDVGDAEAAAFGDSVGDWPPFPDSAEALAALKRRFRLGVITNCDNDLFARTQERLGVEFDWVITAQQAQSYKPSMRNFELAFERIDVPRDRIIHVAQSLFHDHVPAKHLGMTSVWIDRRGDRAGSGATPPAEARPDMTFPDMRSFAEAALDGG